MAEVVDRDRVLKENEPLPASVDALDELLLAVPKSTGLQFDPAMGFHFYGADLCLAAHLTSAKMLCGREPSDYPTAARIYANCMAMEAFSAEHPLRQPDAPAS